MSVYKRKGSKYWWYHFTFKGQPVQDSSKVTNRREAEGIERAARVALAKNEWGLDGKPKPRKIGGELIDLLVRNFELRDRYNTKNANLIKHVRSYWADRWIETCSKEGLERFEQDIDHYRATLKANAAANSTINHYVQIVLQGARLAKLPTPKITKLSEQDSVRSGFFPDDEYRRTYSHLGDYADFSLYAYLVGWRKSAISSLTWGDIQDDNIYLRALCSKNRQSYFVPIIGGSELASLIERRRQARKITTPAGVTLSNLVFHRNGQPIGDIRKAWATACRKAGCPGRLFHDLRRTAARNLRRSGVPEAVAMRITGHATASMFKRYSITDESDLREAMTKVDAYHREEQRKVVAIK
jgi:integrase